MDRRIQVVRGARRLLGGTAALGIWLFVSLLLASPAGATLKEVTIIPPTPTTCDTIGVTVAGELPDPCYEIVAAKISSPVPIPCLRPTPCPIGIRVEITVREPNPLIERACPLVITPYTRSFEVGKLPPGEYIVTAIERVIPFAADSTDSVVGTTFASAQFFVRADSSCAPGIGCYILDLAPERNLDAFVIPFCTASGPPGGTACLNLTLLNSDPVGGLQTWVNILNSPDGVPPGSFLHAVSVEAIGHAKEFQVAWTADGARTKILLYSTTGAVIPAGNGPIVRICYSIAPETPTQNFPIVTAEEIVADPVGKPLIACPTFARVGVGRICVGPAPPGCDLNGDGASDVLDVILLVRCALAGGSDSSATCPDSVAARADCNGDGSIDIRDVICCVRKIVHLLRGTGQPGTDTGSGEGTAIGFAGQVRWINEVEGFATVQIKATQDWGGVQFSLDPTGAPVRIRGLKLAEAATQDQIEWAVDGSGVAHAIVYTTAAGPGASRTLRLEVALERVQGPSGPGTVRLGGVRAGTASGAPASATAFNPVLAISQASVAAPALLGARPNPAPGRTEIGFVLPADARVVLRVYDVGGRLVRTLLEGPTPAGVHRIPWDGTDSRGRSVTSGIYFSNLEVGNQRRSGRFMLLR